MAGCVEGGAHMRASRSERYLARSAAGSKSRVSLSLVEEGGVVEDEDEELF